MEATEESADAPDGARPSEPGPPEPAPSEPGPPRPAPPRRPRGRTAALIGAAAALGLVAGTCAGYLIQADRKPTALPPLSQPVIEQSTGKAPEPLSAAQDRRVATDGDLRKLLLKKPRGAGRSGTAPTSGWMDMADYAAVYTKPGLMFDRLSKMEFRRAAVTGWREGRTFVQIRLVQFRQEEERQAVNLADDNQYWATNGDDNTLSTDSWAVPGTQNGWAYVHRRPRSEPGFVPLYTAEAHAWRGDIAMEIWVTSTGPVSKAKIMDLAERQMERL